MNHCPNCHQPLLPEDTSCWQCGFRVEAPPAEEEVPVPVRERWSIHEGSMAVPLAADERSRAIYTALTIGLVILLMILINRLRAAPLSQVSFGDVIPVGYQVVSNDLKQFSFDLPSSWLTLDPLTLADRPALETVLASEGDLLTEATQPWGELAGDLELLFLALPAATWEPGQEPFVTVAGSEALAGIEPEAAVAIAEQTGWLAVSQAEYIEDNDKSHVRIDMVTYPLDETRQAEFSGLVYLCSQQVISRTDMALVVAVCLPQRGTQTALANRNGQILRDNVLESFQFLKN